MAKIRLESIDECDTCEFEDLYEDDRVRHGYRCYTCSYRLQKTEGRKGSTGIKSLFHITTEFLLSEKKPYSKLREIEKLPFRISTGILSAIDPTKPGTEEKYGLILKNLAWYELNNDSFIYKFANYK